MVVAGVRYELWSTYLLFSILFRSTNCYKIGYASNRSKIQIRDYADKGMV